MKAVKVIAVLAIIGAVTWLAILDHREIMQERAIVSHVRNLLDACKSMGDSASPTIKGKALVWDMTSDSRSDAHDRLPSELKATSADSQITVFMVIGERNVQVGTYSVSGEPAYRQYMDVAVAYWPEKKAVGMGYVVSKEPRSSRPVEHRPEYGDPYEPIANWISTLPKAR